MEIKAGYKYKIFINENNNSNGTIHILAFVAVRGWGEIVYAEKRYGRDGWRTKMMSTNLLSSFIQNGWVKEAGKSNLDFVAKAGQGESIRIGTP